MSSQRRRSRRSAHAVHAGARLTPAPARTTVAARVASHWPIWASGSRPRFHVPWHASDRREPERERLRYLLGHGAAANARRNKSPTDKRSPCSLKKLDVEIAKPHAGRQPCEISRVPDRFHLNAPGCIHDVAKEDRSPGALHHGISRILRRTRRTQLDWFHP